MNKLEERRRELLQGACDYIHGKIDATASYIDLLREIADGQTPELFYQVKSQLADDLDLLQNEYETIRQKLSRIDAVAQTGRAA